MPGGLLTALGVARFKAHLEAWGRYAGVQALLISALVVLVVVAAGFAVAALTIWLSAQLGAAAAFAVVAAGLLALALLLQIVILVRKRKKARVAPLFGDGDRSDQVAFGSLAAIAVIGYLLGRRTERH